MIALSIIACLIFLHWATGKSKTDPIFSPWLFGEGGNNNELYCFKTQDFTTIECLCCTKEGRSKMANSKAEAAKSDNKSLFVWIFIHLKALTMLAVVIAILAVDFPPIFDRRLCKTEEIGISLMDTGVALITLNAGISGPKARPWKQTSSWLKELLISVRSVILPLIVGTLRFWIISDFDY